jgi:hypothetical protein
MVAPAFIVVITLRVMVPRSGTPLKHYAVSLDREEKNTARKASGHHAERDDYD